MFNVNQENPLLNNNEDNQDKIPCLWCDEENRKYQSLKGYLDYQFSRRSRLLVVRLDLGFIPGSLGQNHAGHARDCFKHFMNNKRQLDITKSMVGYAWALEFGIEKGCHYHCIFLFDGARSQQDLSLAHAIGQYWIESITNGTGTYFCSNDNKARFEAEGTLGVGMIHRNDHDKRTNLLNVASYLVKGDEHLQAVLPEGEPNIRTFGKGGMPKNI